MGQGGVSPPVHPEAKLLGQGWQIGEYSEITQEEFFITEGIDAIPINQGGR